MIQKILVPLDSSPLADGVLGLLPRLLRSNDAEVTLFAVIPENVLGHALLQSRDPTLVARRHLEDLCAALVKQGVRAVTSVVRGDPATLILQFARSIHPSIIALSTHGRTLLDGLPRGSTAEWILRHSPYPVLAVNPRAVHAEQGRFRRILVPLDGSELSAEILPMVLEIGRLHESEIVLFHAIETGTYFDPMPAVYPAESFASVERLLEPFRQRLAGVSVSLRSTVGSAAASILEIAQSVNADLIALTTHGRSGPTRWLLGSVAEQVGRHASVPVLVHRAGGLAFSETARAETVAAAPAL